MTFSDIVITIPVLITPSSTRENNMKSLFVRVRVIAKRYTSCY